MKIAIEDLLQNETDWVTADKVVCPRPCFLLDGMLTGDGGGASDCTIRNGHTSSADIKLKVRAVDDATQPFSLKRPVYMSSGLYVDVGSNVEGVFVQYFEPMDRPASKE